MPNLLGMPMMTTRPTVGPIPTDVRTMKYKTPRANPRTGARVATGGPYRYQAPGPVGGGIGVQATIPASQALGAGRQGATRLPPVYGTQGANVVSPLFGRPGFTYAYTRPAPRMGTAPKLAPGTGGTGKPANRAQGFVPTAYASQQYIDLNQYDYTPPTDPYYGIKNEANNSTIPRSIGVGVDGVSLVGTYRAHDSTPADRFFKQGRSSGLWEDMTFGPQYRFLLPYQQVARYNIYSELALARMLPQNAYFLGYQTQPGIAAQIAGNGQGAPLGYGAH